MNDLDNDNDTKQQTTNNRQHIDHKDVAVT